MVDDVEVSSDQLVFQICPVWNHDLVSLIGDDDTCTGKSDSLAKPDISRDGKVVEFSNVGDGFESFLKVLRTRILSARFPVKDHDVE